MSFFTSQNHISVILPFYLLLTLTYIAQLYTKFTLTRHTKAVNALTVSPHGAMLLSGGRALSCSFCSQLIRWSGNDSCVVVWNLTSSKMLQEFCVPSAGFISCLVWIKLSDGEEDTFVFGASDGNIHLYKWSKDHPLCTFCSIVVAHKGTIESLAWDSVHCHLASVGNSEVGLWNVSSKASKSSYLVSHLS